MAEQDDTKKGQDTEEGADVIPLRAPTPLGPCPLCAKPGDPAYKPFCSKRCADLDLGQWLSEGYRVAGDEPGGVSDEDEEV